MHLAIIISSNICVPTARAMVGDDDGLRLDSIWLRQEIPPLVRNPIMQEALDAEASRRDDEQLHDPATTKAMPLSVASGDSDAFKNSYAEARGRARLCSKPPGQAGWTQGFRPDAWRQPFAELDFLRDCCRYVQYDAKLVVKRDRWNNVTGRKKMSDGRPVTAADVHTGLPREHPLIRVQEVFRQQFRRLQVAELVRGAETSDAWALRETFIREVAPLLSALSPITDDPHLHERFWIDRKSPDVRIAVEGAWNC